jgi:hypothetical protein
MAIIFPALLQYSAVFIIAFFAGVYCLTRAAAFYRTKQQAD